MTDPAPPKTFPSIQGRCPACRGDSLFIGSGGYVTCSRIDCPNPSAADQLLHGEQPTPAATRADTCGHTIPGVFGRPLGPCHRRPGHPELFHQDATGAEWRPTRTADNEEQPTPAATFSLAEYEDIKTRWSKTYGKPGTAHPVTEVHHTSEEPRP